MTEGDIETIAAHSMDTKLCAVAILVLFNTGQLLAGHNIYHTPSVSITTPDNSSCPPDSHMETVKTNIVSNLVDNLIKIAVEKTNNYTIPACGGSGWRRLVFLNMTDPDQTCPDSWRLYKQNSIRACGRQPSHTATCDSLKLGTDGYAYNQVCGRIKGYQYASPDGLAVIQHDGTIDSVYVDGVSITYGMAPRKHIWTLYAGVREFSFGCCTNVYAAPEFVESNYFCDTGNPTNTLWSSVLFTEYPLWDGIAGCVTSTTCCAPQSGPWFHAILSPVPTTDDVEIRICGGEGVINEDTPLELVEIYIKQ